MLNQRKLIGYHAGETFLHGLSGASKMLFFVLVSVAAMISYDTRFFAGASPAVPLPLSAVPYPHPRYFICFGLCGILCCS